MIDAMSNAVMGTYKRLPVAFASGAGAWLFDEQGNRYLDALSGLAVCGLGHAHPAVTGAVAEQAGRLIHTSNLYQVPLQEQLAGELCTLSGHSNVFFNNSGAEANETAIKICRKYGHDRGLAAPQIVVMEGSFHGRTLATLTATAGGKQQESFAPLPQGFLRIPYNDVTALAALAGEETAIVAVMLEPIQGEGGIIIPEPGYLRQVAQICRDNGWLLTVDEVQTGMCRTGRWFACQHDEVLPDIMTLAKSLANGVPIGACLAAGEAAATLTPGSHGSTFGGNPLAARAALAVLMVMREQQLDKRAAELGTGMLAEFRQRLAGLDGIREIRGKGMMLGIELDRDCGDLVKLALERRLLINVTRDNVVRLLPPLIISDAEAEKIIDGVSDLITGYLSGP
jgi:acetylornithine/N-succinyldiaminopimelate aminotransferase